MNLCKILPLITLILVAGCASKPVTPAPAQPQSAEEQSFLKEAKSACEKGSGYGCYIVGESILQQSKNYKEAIPLLKKGCDDNWAYACSDLAFAKSESAADKSVGFPDAMKSCELGDGIGCYNAACYSCPKKPDQATDYIKKSFLLGYNDADHMLKDPDLACISGRKELQNLSAMMRARKDAEITDDFHVFAKSLGGAVLIPQGFEILNGDPLVAYDTSGARIFYSSSNFSVNQSIDLEKANQNQGKVIEERLSTKNGLIYYFKKTDLGGSDQNIISVIGITGTENFTLQVTSYYPKILDSQFDKIFSAVASSLVLKPWNLPDATSSLLMLNPSKKLNHDLRYAGKVSSSLHFTQSGKMDPNLKNVFILQPVIIPSNEKFNSDFAKKQIDPVIQGLLKLEPYKINPIKNFNNQWNGFTALVTGNRLQNIKEKINLKVHLFNTGKKLSGFSVLALALTISDADQPNQNFLKAAEDAVLKIKINQKVYLESQKSKLQLPKEKAAVGTGRSKVGLNQMRAALLI